MQRCTAVRACFALPRVCFYPTLRSTSHRPLQAMHDEGVTQVKDVLYADIAALGVVEAVVGEAAGKLGLKL